jgi:hypothetical protein
LINFRNSSCCHFLSSSSPSVFEVWIERSFIRGGSLWRHQWWIEEFVHYKPFQLNLITLFTFLIILLHLFEAKTRESCTNKHCHSRYVNFSTVTILLMLICVWKSMKRRF